ncbi:MAG: DUF4249 domain-containing protein [Chitinophagaceae bacterium]|nr:MAG: DUF4249 domain-containing protein [Chitinophagaceae bacterium]
MSCEKVIDIDLKSADKKFVIEANLSNQAGNCRVLLTRTKDFDESNSFEGVTGALVTIREEGGATTALGAVQDGVYESATLAGTSGKTYHLSVQVDGQEFTATSTMPVFVRLDTIYVTRETLFSDGQLIVNAEFQDPPGPGNNYRFIQYFNGVKEDQLQFMNDDYTDGRYVNSKLFYFNDDDEDDLKQGDEVLVEMYTIDANMYKYWFSLFRSSTGDSNQATPSNPVSNMQGGALGYFSAHTKQSKGMVIP